MKEAAFVKQNYEKWQEFEQALGEGLSIKPDHLADLFIQVTDDLSFSRTQYPKSETTQYLNNLATKIHLEIYKNKKEDKNRFIRFWTHEVPFLFKSAHKQLFYAFAFFAIGIAIGAVSSWNDDTFVRLILGDAYVNKTLTNIESGNPLGIYGTMSEEDMFFAITFNNIKVSFIAFALGIFISIGTGYVLLSNGIMVGAFLTMFAQKGLLLDSILIIMLHGTLELSAIVIAGTAGFIMGNSILFPGTYSRLASFKKGAVKGLKIAVSLIPIFIVAGFIESFITRYTFMHWSIKLTIILISAIFIVYYFLIYPIKLHKKDGN